MLGRRVDLGVFLGAVLLAALVGHLLRDSPGYAVRTESGYEGDIVHYVYWTRLVTEGGIQAAYSGIWPETYAVYPPIPLYAYQAIGNAYRLLEDPSFDPGKAQDSLWLHEAIKLVALGWHLLTGLAIYLLVKNKWAAAFYVANPAALYDVAHWGQPDGAHALFSVLAIGLLELRQVGPAWLAMALAALAKPQAWAIAPVFALASLRREGLRSTLVGLGMAVGVSLLVVSPFIVTGHLRELLTLPTVISSVMPVASADAHNLWWLVLEQRGLDPLFTQDSTRLIGPLTYRIAALLLVIGVWAVTWWLYWTGRVRLAEAAALGVLGWFVCTTQAHENHLFFVLPLLALAWPDRRGLLAVFWLLTLTVLLNMVLHDQLVLEGLGKSLDDPLVASLRTANAVLNVLVLICWTAAAVLRGAPARVRQAPALLRSPSR